MNLRHCFNRLFAVPLALLLVAGCTSVEPNRTPKQVVVDTRNVNLAKYDADYADCVRFSNKSKASLGAVAGDMAGAFYGLATGRRYSVKNMGPGHAEAERRAVFAGCMKNRGYTVVSQ